MSRDDKQLGSMTRAATQFASALHIVDAILLISPCAHFKYWCFAWIAAATPLRSTN
jgi:hypothetical protein